jgi:fructosamine-3-kinase
MPPILPTDQGFSAVAEAICGASGTRFRLRAASQVGGGCINENFRLDGDGARYFLKRSRGGGAMFAAEVDGLAALAQCPAVVVPRPIVRGSAGDTDFLVLEWLDLTDLGDEARLGEALAALHAIECERYGWARDNFIGRTPQANAALDDWPTFFRERRLRPQLALAARRGAIELARQAEPLLEKLPALFAAYTPAKSLLHGDLWRGNVGFVAGRPALFDPAVHAGDAESDLAMTELFGGFGSRFYAAYRAQHRLDAGYGVRRGLYQLYHVLNHFNLFGGGYAAQAASLIEKLDAELR